MAPSLPGLDAGKICILHYFVQKHTLIIATHEKKTQHIQCNEDVQNLIVCLYYGPTGHRNWPVGSCSVQTVRHLATYYCVLTDKRIHSSTVQSEIGTVFLTILSIHYSLNNSGVISINCIWGTPPDLVKGSCDPSVRSQRHSSLFQPALHLCIWRLLLCTQHCRHVHSHWSGVFNLLKFDHISKKERKPATRTDGPLSVTRSLARRLLVRPSIDDHCY